MLKEISVGEAKGQLTVRDRKLQLKRFCGIGSRGQFYKTFLRP